MVRLIFVFFFVFFLELELVFSQTFKNSTGEYTFDPQAGKIVKIGTRVAPSPVSDSDTVDVKFSKNTKLNPLDIRHIAKLNVSVPDPVRVQNAHNTELKIKHVGTHITLLKNGSSLSVSSLDFSPNLSKSLERFMSLIATLNKNVSFDNNFYNSFQQFFTPFKNFDSRFSHLVQVLDNLLPVLANISVHFDSIVMDLMNDYNASLSLMSHPQYFGPIVESLQALSLSLNQTVFQAVSEISDQNRTFDMLIKLLYKNFSRPLNSFRSSDGFHRFTFRVNSFGSFFSGLLGDIESLLAHFFSNFLIDIYNFLKHVLEDFLKFLFKLIVSLLPLFDEFVKFLLYLFSLVLKLVKEVFSILNKSFFASEFLLAVLLIFFKTRDLYLTLLVAGLFLLLFDLSK